MRKETDNRILDALRQALRGEALSAEETFSPEQWKDFFHACLEHSVLPLVMDAMPPAELAEQEGGPDRELLSACAARARSEILKQASRTAELCLLYRHLRSKGLHPLMMKGIVCRALYPEPEHRPSIDEDILVRPAEFRKMHEVLLEYGLTAECPEWDVMEKYEVTYRNKEKMLYLEVHKTPFSPGSPFLDRLNDSFLGVYERTVTQRICGTEFLTLSPEDHISYLLLHALKHFLHSGFGIRQICDVALFAEANRDQIDWAHLREQLDRLNALDFSRAVFRIADLLLLPENHMEEYLTDWDLAGVYPEPLLEDVMEGGVYGCATMSRLHSSNMTMRAASSQSAHGLSAVLYSLFPPLEAMQGKFPYLKKLPVLLPLAWLQRQVGYLWELIRHRGRSNSALKSIQVGSERIQLLKKYHIIQ